jgi:hypothetical protein
MVDQGRAAMMGELEEAAPATGLAELALRHHPSGTPTPQVLTSTTTPATNRTRANAARTLSHIRSGTSS